MSLCKLKTKALLQIEKASREAETLMFALANHDSTEESKGKARLAILNHLEDIREWASAVRESRD